MQAIADRVDHLLSAVSRLLVSPTAGEGAAVKEMEAAAVAWVCQQVLLPLPTPSQHTEKRLIESPRCALTAGVRCSPPPTPAELHRHGFTSCRVARFDRELH